MTVSPGYAEEIKSWLGGWGMEGVINQRAPVLNGIVNGIDTEWVAVGGVMQGLVVLCCWTRMSQLLYHNIRCLVPASFREGRPL